MTGWSSDFVWGVLKGLGPCFLFLIITGRFSVPARRDKPPRSFWRLLGRVFIEDFGSLILLIGLLAPTAGDWRLFTSVPGWIGAGFAGLIDVAFLYVMATRKAPVEEQRYYRLLILLYALAIVGLTALECAVFGFGSPWISNLLVPGGVFVALSAGIYVVRMDQADRAPGTPQPH